MRKIRPLLWAACILFSAQNIIAQEKFIDVRQGMADDLTAMKSAMRNNDWPGAQENFNKAKKIWQDEIKPMIVEGVKRDAQFQEYFSRIDEVDRNLDSLALSLESKNDKEIEGGVNAIIWGISHHPRGFDVPKPRYTTWDWVFGLGIGIGFCLFAIFFGLYLRKSYYRRYKRDNPQKS